MYIATTALE